MITLEEKFQSNDLNSKCTKNKTKQKKPVGKHKNINLEQAEGKK